MIIRESGPGWSVYQKPSHITYRERLSTGQVLTVKFNRLRHGMPDGGYKGVIYLWIVTVHIGNHWRESGRYQYKKNRITGRSGLEGLRAALRVIRSVTPVMDYRDEMQIAGSDERRNKAYRYLLRYPGFVDGGNGLIGYRNPELYYWKLNEGGADDGH